MKRLVVAMLVILAILPAVAAGAAYAAPEAITRETVGSYEGKFQGVAYGDKGSRAPLSLELTHRGNEVEGSVSLGEGLYVDGGFCGKVHVPVTAQYVEGQTVPGNPKRLVVTPTFEMGGFELAVDFESNVVADGNVIVAKATVDLPWLCGRDPSLTGILYRD